MARQVAAMVLSGKPAFEFTGDVSDPEEVKTVSKSSPAPTRPRVAPGGREVSTSGKVFTRVPAHFLLKQMSSRVALTPPTA